MNNSLIFGKNSKENIVSCEINDSNVELFIEKDGNVTSEFIPNTYWVLGPRQFSSGWSKLDGNLHFKYIKTFKTKSEHLDTAKKAKAFDLYTIWDDKEAAMVYNGFTYFKGLKIKDVSILSFDIESTGLVHDNDSKVLIISNTFRSINCVERKLFCYDEYNSEAELFDAWCVWVREKNPSVIVGHNIYSYDLPYMNFCASKCGTTLALGRDGSDIKISNRESDFRIDGSKDHQYKKSFIYGREIVDTMFLSYRYDIGRKYESYGLKSIIKHENLEIANRQFYDAGQIRFNYKNPTEWEKIKKYALHDADDALALYDLMIPSYFYLTRSIPKSFQSMMLSASGSQINSFLVRSYLQVGHSIAKANDKVEYEGAISIGNPGVYNNVFKVDVASLYPSIMIQYNIFDRYKDPRHNFSEMVKYFTNERLQNKKLAKETGDIYYKDLEQSQKIVINSSYGMLAAPGLNFNSPANAALVTRKGREILQKSIDWALAKGFTLVNADTDSISISYNNEPLDAVDQQDIIDSINQLFPEKIRFEHDGYYENVLVIKIKNYCLVSGGKKKIKGSALKATMKEPRFKVFIDDVINKLLIGRSDEITNVYHECVKDIFNIKDIVPYCSKKNITENVLNAERTNEQNILDAIAGTDYKQGDKIYVYFTPEGKLKLKEHWSNDHCPINLLEKLYKTLEVFETVIDIKSYKNYSLVKFQNDARMIAGLEPLEKKKRQKKEKL